MTTKQEQDRRNFVHTVEVLMASALAQRDVARGSRRTPAAAYRRPRVALAATGGVILAVLILIGGVKLLHRQTDDSVAVPRVAVATAPKSAEQNQRIRIEEKLGHEAEVRGLPLAELTRREQAIANREKPREAEHRNEMSADKITRSGVAPLTVDKTRRDDATEKGGGGAEYASPQVAFEQGLGAYKAGYYEIAIPALEAAAAQGPALNRFFAEFYLARIYSDNNAAQTDHRKAYLLFQKLAEENADANSDDGKRAPFVAKALTALAGYLRNGLKEAGVEPDAGRAMEYLQHAATFFDDKDAQFELAKIYLTANGGEDVNRGMHYLSVLTSEGHAGAQAVLADLYWRGRFVKKDEQRALALIRMAVENAPAHERIWIEDIYQHIFCGASQGVRNQADGMVAVWRKMFAPPPASVELMGLGGREQQPERTCANGEVVKFERTVPSATKEPAAAAPARSDNMLGPR